MSAMLSKREGWVGVVNLSLHRRQQLSHGTDRSLHTWVSRVAGFRANGLECYRFVLKSSRQSSRRIWQTALPLLAPVCVVAGRGLRLHVPQRPDNASEVMVCAFCLGLQGPCFQFDVKPGSKTAWAATP